MRRMPRFVCDGPGRAADEIERPCRERPTLLIAEGMPLGRRGLEEYRLR